MKGKKIGLVSFGIVLLFSVMLVPFASAAPTISTGDTSNTKVIQPSLDKNPILFVHGWGGSASFWDSMRNKFIIDGYSSDLLYAYTFSSSWGSGNGINAKNAQQIQTWVNYILASTGASQIDLVSHSMGGLSTRYYIKFLDGINKVDDYVSLGSPHHGASLANWIGGDMKSGSYLLTQLNSGDETPGNVEWTTIRSTSDNLVNPTDSAMLDGAFNHLIRGVGHIALLSNAGVYSLVSSAVA